MIESIPMPDFSSWLCKGLGGLFGLMSWQALSKSERLTGKGISTQAEITRLVWKSDYESGSYFPEFRFTTAEGREYTVMSSMGSSPTFLRVGQQVRVLYDPDDPNAAEIDTMSRLWLLPGLFAVTGIVVFGVGLGRYLAHWSPA